jgi:hypothetical protein
MGCPYIEDIVHLLFNYITISILAIVTYYRCIIRVIRNSWVTVDRRISLHWSDWETSSATD